MVKGVSPRKRRIYKIWVERKPPDVVIETTSRKTRRKDMVTKPELYARLGIKEYFLVDPDHEYLDPPLQGHRLTEGAYVRIEPDPTGALVSEELGLKLQEQSGEIEFYRLDTGERLLTAEERAANARQAEAEARQAEAEARRAVEENRQVLEAEIVRLKAELARRPPA